jgi:glycopeptide antibiotics resistance protein
MDDLEASSLSQGKYTYKKFKTEQSLGKVAATFLFDVYGVLLVGFTALISTINAAVYQETLKRHKETIRQKRPGC